MEGWHDHPDHNHRAGLLQRPGPERRGRVPAPRSKAPRRCGRPFRGWSNGPVPSPGPTRSSWSPACNAKCPPGSATGGGRRIRATHSWPQEPGVVRLRPRPRPQAGPDRPPGHARLRHREGQPAAARTPRPRARPTWPPGRRSAPAKPGDPHLPSRSSGAVRDRRRVWHPALAAAPTTAAACRTSWSSTRSVTSLRAPEAANLFFQLVSGRYERASLPSPETSPSDSGESVFGDAVVAAAVIDRLVHHAEVIALQGGSYRLIVVTLDASQPARPTTTDRRVNCHLPDGGQFQPPLTCWSDGGDRTGSSTAAGEAWAVSSLAGRVGPCSWRTHLTVVVPCSWRATPVGPAGRSSSTGAAGRCPTVACQREGTRVLPRPRDHLGRMVMVMSAPRLVNQDTPVAAGRGRCCRR